VITRRVVAAPGAKRRSAEPVLAQLVERAPHPAGQRLEVRDRKHHVTALARHPRHLGDRFFGRVEVIHRALAEGAVEAVARERKPIRPAPHEARHRTGLVRREEHRHPRHARRRLDADHVGAPGGEGDRVLADAARDVEHPSPGSRLGPIERDAGHPIEQEFAVRRQSGRDDVAHVAIEVDDSHRIGD